MENNIFPIIGQVLGIEVSPGHIEEDFLLVPLKMLYTTSLNLEVQNIVRIATLACSMQLIC
jgi:hypothetical protein